MDIAAASDARVIVRVKRLRDEEPLPELVMEAPPVSAKRSRADAAAAALRLVDSVPSGGWPGGDDGGLPLSWFRAAADATWGPATWEQQERCPPTGPPPTISSSLLREANRQMVTGASGEPVQLIDVEPSSLAAIPSRPAQVPAASIFTLGGQPLVATPTGVAQPPPAAAGCDEDTIEGDFVWDVYTLSDCSPKVGHGFGGAHLKLSAPVFDVDSDALEDLNDIDDSQSEADSWEDRCGLSGGSSAGDFEDGPERPWVDSLD
mmetsp:Transcript_77619/g.231278  ORF Transcript_77619/g.231278 Transcript_77619/m.231278 type:complete len:262 (-) Transcript_77619:9-794(-)